MELEQGDIIVEGLAVVVVVDVGRLYSQGLRACIFIMISFKNIYIVLERIKKLKLRASKVCNLISSRHLLTAEPIVKYDHFEENKFNFINDRFL